MWMYTGQDAIITADVNRMSLDTYFTMAEAFSPNPNDPAGAAGSEIPGNIGTILATEGQTFGLCVMFPYSAKAAYNAQLPPCYWFPLATLESPDDIDPGTQDLTIHMVWHAIRAFAAATANGISTFTSQLYSLALPAGLPAPT